MGNYGAFSNVFVESKYDSKMHFLKHPELVASDGYTVFSSGLWFYMTPQNPKPSIHDVVTGLFKPNNADKQAGIKGGFGTTINIINGGMECGGGVSHQAAARGRYYKEFINALGLDASKETDLGCASERSFPEGGAGDIEGYFQAGEVEFECELVPW